jgi:metal transporter CNNM
MQDEVYLQVIKTSGEGHERKNATSVLKLLNHGKHWVLVTLLLSNVITNETLPIVLDRTLGGGWPAVLGSTALIVIFGEIVPQSICVRYGLPIGAWMAPCVLVLMYIMSPVAWPIAKLLDRLLGEDHGTIYKKAGLKTLVTLHKTLGEAGEQLNSDEVTIISAVLDLKEKSVGSIMTPMEDVFTMSADTVLDERTMDLILSQGYSRIPIHAPDNTMNFVGMLLVKMLITYDPEDCKRVRDFALATLPETRPETSCLDIVNFFQEGKSHMVLVSEYPSEDRGALGVVTLEDVIEELIGEEIIDESDVFIDVHKAIRRMAPAPKSRVPKGKIVEEPPLNASVVTDGDLIDVDPVQPSSLPKPSDLIRRRSSVEAPLPRFQLRKNNADVSSNSTDGWVTQVGTTDEIREHLKHLGPSNLASRPRQTRYHAVKIKRSNTSPSRSAQTDLESGQSISDSQRLVPSAVAYQGGIGAGLLNSAGQDAKDGAHALKIGYGTLSSSDNASKGTSAQQYKDLPHISIPESVREEHEDQMRSESTQEASSVAAHEDKDQPQSGSTRKASSTEGSIRSLDSPSGFPYHHRGPARSGSITEQIVDVNGIRKVVLHANCSSSSDSESHQSGNHHHNLKHSSSGQSHNQGAALDTDDAKSQNPDSVLSKLKKKRRRKKHAKASKTGAGPSEDQPLLQ